MSFFDENKMDDSINKMIENIESEEVRRKIYDEISLLALVSSSESFSKLISEIMKYPEGLKKVQESWRTLINNSKISDNVFDVMFQDEEIQKQVLKDVDFLIKYGNFSSYPILAEKLATSENGANIVAENFEKFLKYSYSDLDKLFISVLDSEIGRKKAKENLLTIRKSSRVREFFNFIDAIENVEGFKEIYEEYGFWSTMYKQIQIPGEDELSSEEPYKFSESQIYELVSGDYKQRKKENIFSQIVNSETRREKRAILEDVSKGEPFEFKGIGSFSIVAKTRDKVVKLSIERDRYKIPYHPRLMMPIFRKEYDDYSYLEVFNLGEPLSSKITDEMVLKIYKELEEAGIIWTDARRANLVELLEDNNLPDYIKSENFNLLGFLDDERYPTTEHNVLKKGEIVISDLDMLYPDNQDFVGYGPIPRILREYIHQKDKKTKDIENKEKER